MIWNSDQGSHFTSPQYLDLTHPGSVQISMDGRGRALDNIFTERLWRTVKYEEVYLQSYPGLFMSRHSHLLFLWKCRAPRENASQISAIQQRGFMPVNNPGYTRLVAWIFAQRKQQIVEQGLGCALTMEQNYWEWFTVGRMIEFS